MFHEWYDSVPNLDSFHTKMNPHGIFKFHQVAHQEFAWYLRTLPQIIQIFDSWAGLLEEKDLPNYVYTPTLNLVNYVKSLKIPVICFPRNIKNYKEFCEIVNPDAVSIDYNVDPKEIVNSIKIPVQGGLDPKILLTDKEAVSYTHLTLPTSDLV